jgi:hypothetical protein
MRQLPRLLTYLDQNMKAAGSLKRLEAEEQFHGRRVCEADYDELIVTQLPSVADCLREAGLLGESHGLLHLGNQIENIDVLCAEIDERGSFQRFVVVEDKLCRNPEGRREVLGQIIDYSRRLHELTFDDFADLVPSAISEWCEANRVVIGRALREHRMLLLICSDQVRESLIEYARYLSDVFPLRQMELALMSLNIYSDGNSHLFVPNVAGMMALPERTLVVRVEVTGEGVLPENARISTEWRAEKIDSGRSRIEKGELLDQIGPPGSLEREVAESLVHGASSLGADIEFGDASAKARIYNSSTRRPATLFVVTRRGTFYVRSFSRWLQAADVKPELSQHYLEELTAIIGKSPLMASGDAAGKRAINLRELKGKEHRVLEVVGKLVPVLRDAPAPEETTTK